MRRRIVPFALGAMWGAAVLFTWSLCIAAAESDRQWGA